MLCEEIICTGAELPHTEAAAAAVQTKGSRELQISRIHASVLIDVNDDNQTESIKVEMNTKLKEKKVEKLNNFHSN